MFIKIQRVHCVHYGCTCRLVHTINKDTAKFCCMSHTASILTKKADWGMCSNNFYCTNQYSLHFLHVINLTNTNNYRW